MAYFNFAISNKPVVKQESNIIHKNIKGVVFITDRAEYKVLFKDTLYDITDKSFSCKGVTTIYRQGISDKRGRPICYVRERDLSFDRDRLYWTPFTAGSLVSGNIIKDSGNMLFDVQDITIDYNNDKCHEARLYYLDNYKQINKIMNKKILNAFR